MDFTLNFGAINLLVVFGATAAANLLGGIWYAPFVFGGLWRRVSGLPGSQESMVNPAGTFVSGFILQLIAASLLAGILGTNAGLVEGVQLGTLLGFGFVFTALAVTNLFERRSLILILINAGYHIVAMGIMGAIIGSWG